MKPDKPQRFQDLEHWIRNAFRNCEYPGDDHIVYADPNDFEACDVAASLKGKHWESLLKAEDLLLYHNCSLGFLTPKAFLFYLPAFLIDSLSCHDSNVVRDMLLYELCIADTMMPRRKRQFDIIRLMTYEQKCVIRTFLEFLIDQTPKGVTDDLPAQALKSFWSRFPCAL